MSLSHALDASGVEGLALDKQPTGYTASIYTTEWSPREFASSASEAIEKCLRLHGRPAPALVQSVADVAPVPVLAPPPY